MLACPQLPLPVATIVPFAFALANPPTQYINVVGTCMHACMIPGQEKGQKK